MRNIYFMGEGLNALYIKNDEYKLKFGILKIEEYVSSYFKLFPKGNIVKPDTKSCKAHLYFDDNNMIYSNLNNRDVTYKQELNLTKYDILVVNIEKGFMHDKINFAQTKDICKIIRVSTNTLADIIKHGHISNALLIIEEKTLEENEIYFNTSEVNEIYKTLRRIPNITDAIYIIDNYYILQENNEFKILYHKEQKRIYGFIDVLISGLIMAHDFSLEESLRFAIKLGYFYNELGYLKKDETIKSAIKKDIDIHIIKINKAGEILSIGKNDFKTAKNIVVYGYEAISVPYYKYEDIILINQEIINEHKELRKILNKKILTILVKGENPLNYIRAYFDNKIYENLTNIDEIMICARNENVSQKRGIFYFDNIDETLKTQLLQIAQKGLYKKEIYELLIEEMTLIFNVNDDVKNYDILINSPSLETKIERAIYLRKKLEQNPNIFTENECHISNEVLNIFINSKLYYNETSIDKILNLTKLEDVEYLNESNLPAKNIRQKYLETIINDDILEELAVKLTTEDEYKSDKEKYIMCANAIINSLDDKNIFHRKADKPLEFALTEEEIEYIAMQKNKNEWQFMPEKDKQKEKMFIKRIPKILSEIGYELYLH